MKKEQEKLPENAEKKQTGEVSRRDFLVGAGTVVVGGAIGTGILSGCDAGETKTVTTTKTVDKISTVTVGDGTPVTVTETKQVGSGETVTSTSTKTITEGGIDPAYEEEETFVRCGNLSGYGGPCMAVDVKNGKIIRMRPLHYDEKYSMDEISGAFYEVNIRDKTYKPTIQDWPQIWIYSYKKRVYSPNRVKYPLKRVDFDPNGERNVQNRGKSKYKRISWDEAASIVASEIKRIQETYGPYSIQCIGEDGHHEPKQFHCPASCAALLLSNCGGYTREVRNPDSWEGNYWGAAHVYGMQSIGFQNPEPYAHDIAANVELMVWIGGDWETTCRGRAATRWLDFYKELGIMQVYICPELTWAAAHFHDKWIPVYPGTDAALQLAIIYVWLQNGTYDQEYLDTHAIGFDAEHMPEGADPKDNFKDYVLGTYDGEPKTPAWAAPKCGVPEYTIKALAEEWGRKGTSTSVMHMGANQMRGPFGHETTRIEITQLAMQGWGRLGVNSIHGGTNKARPKITPSSSAAGRATMFRSTPQFLPRTQTHHAILEGSTETWGSTSMVVQAEDQFIKYVYPIATEDGGAKIHMWWSEKPCNTACWNDGFMFIRAAQSTEMEFFVANHQWMENDLLLADIIFPVSTHLELNDIISNTAGYSADTTTLIYQKKAIQAVGESKSDYDIAGEVAKKLEQYGGIYEGLYEKYTGGMNEDEWLKTGWEKSNVADQISWEDLKEKGYKIFDVNPNWNEGHSGYLKFYEDPDANPLTTPSGKLEIYSARIAEVFPDDQERPPIPKWVEGGPGWTHDENRSGERFKTYPLLQVSNHPRWRQHVQMDDSPWLREIENAKIKGYDGYLYEPVWMNPIDATSRGIVHGDIVKVYNERGIVLCGAYVTEKIREGAVSIDHGARVDLITDGIDRGGSGNLITPSGPMSQNCWGMCVSAFLCEVEKLDPQQMEDWRKTYPEAFARDYDPSCGLMFSGYIEGGEE